MSKRKVFPENQIKTPAKLPNLVQVQINSFNWFLKQGVEEVFEEIFPIESYNGDYQIRFLDYKFGEASDEDRARRKNLTFESPLKAVLQLVRKGKEDKKWTTVEEKEIFLGDFPLISERGTFIVKGVERVVVSQLIRSPGLYFTEDGAKIIPERGSWIQISTDKKNRLWARINKRRKIPLTTLLRVFGWQGQDKGDLGKFAHELEPTLEKDETTNQDEAYIELYKSLRPGEMGSLDNAKSLIDNTFFNRERYDLGRVGRYVFNRRLKKLNKFLGDEELIDIKEVQKNDIDDRLLNLQDVLRVSQGILHRMQIPEERREADDIDHLGNRRVRPVGELLQNRFRLGLRRMSRNIQDKMSTKNVEELGLSRLLNARPLIAVIEQFFASSRLSQFMDQVNPLAELEHKRRLSAIGPGGLTRERAGFEVRDVHLSHYGRICPIQTSEGGNIGLITYLALFAKVNELGFLETPYMKPDSQELVYLDAFEEEKYTIAPWDEYKEEGEKLVPARIKGKPGEIEKSKVDLIDVAPNQVISVATSLIPFLGHDDGQRALMGSNMQRQGVPLLRADSPVVGTGMEQAAARDSGQVVISHEAGKVVEADAEKIRIKGKNKKDKVYKLRNFERSNTDTCLNQRPLVNKGDKVKSGQVLADGSSTDKGELALGENVLVAFNAWEGYNYEDAIVVSQRLVKDEKFTSIQIEEFEADVRDTKLGPEQTTADIPNVSQEKLANLDIEGLIRLGARVESGDILVGKISPKGEKELNAEERLLQAIFGEKARDVKDTSLRLPHGKEGKVVDVQVFSREEGDKLPSGVLKHIEVRVAKLRRLQAGDKLAGRHGDKGVIARILPEEDMPYLPNGQPVDVLLNPLGVVSRMNIGQILETQLGWAAQSLGYKVASPALFGVSQERIKKELKKAGLPKDGQIRLRDGRTGELFDHRSTVGCRYIMKLEHMVEDKLHMRSIGPYSLITQQPLGGKAQFGGQRFGEMEVWALEGYGAAHTLQEMLTIKSDDVVGRSKTYESIIRGQEIKKPHLPASFNVLIRELKGLGLEVEME